MFCPSHSLLSLHRSRGGWIHDPMASQPRFHRNALTLLFALGFSVDFSAQHQLCLHLSKQRLLSQQCHPRTLLHSVCPLYRIPLHHTWHIDSRLFRHVYIQNLFQTMFLVISIGALHGLSSFQYSLCSQFP